MTDEGLMAGPAPLAVGNTEGVLLTGGALLVTGVRRRAPVTEEWLRAHVRYFSADGGGRGARWPGPEESADPSRERRIFNLCGLVSAELADRLIASASSSDAWSSVRHDRHPARDLPVSLLADEAARSELFSVLDEGAIPAVAALFGVPLDHLSLKDVFIVRYDAATDHDRLERHVDGESFAGVSCIGRIGLAYTTHARPRGANLTGSAASPGSFASVNILLSAADDFSGGGTGFAAFGWRPEAVPDVRRGDALLHRGDVEHCGLPVTRGTRYIAVAFVRTRVVDADAGCKVAGGG